MYHLNIFTYYQPLAINIKNITQRAYTTYRFKNINNYAIFIIF